MDSFEEGLKHLWEIVTGIIAASVSYLFYKKKKKEEQLTNICDTLNRQTTDISIFKVELRELKEDIQELSIELKELREDLKVDVKELKEWLFNNKKK